MNQPPGGRVAGRSFYAAPGPTNIPDSVLQAVAQSSIDFMGPGFLRTYESCVESLRHVLGTAGMQIFFYASSGHGTWEATFANLFSPGDRILMLDSGVFSGFWTGIGRAFGLDIQTLTADWRRGVDLDDLSDALLADTRHQIQAVCVVHNDTASGVTMPGDQVRARLNAANHPALYLLDVISSAGSLPLELDAWRVDAAVGSSQKGLMMLPGLGFTAVSPRALAKHQTASLPRAYFDWTRALGRPHLHSLGTVSAAMFNGLRQSFALIEAEGLDNVLSRHRRLATAARAAIHAWSAAGQGPELYCRDLARASNSVSAILLPSGFIASPLRTICAERFHVTLGGDLGLFDDRLFRIGHMGDLNEAMLFAILGATELSLQASGIPHRSGLAAALAALAA